LDSNHLSPISGGLTRSDLEKFLKLLGTERQKHVNGFYLQTFYQKGFIFKHILEGIFYFRGFAIKIGETCISSTPTAEHPTISLFMYRKSKKHSRACGFCHHHWRNPLSITWPCMHPSPIGFARRTGEIGMVDFN